MLGVCRLSDKVVESNVVESASAWRGRVRVSEEEVSVLLVKIGTAEAGIRDYGALCFLLFPRPQHHQAREGAESSERDGCSVEDAE